jgi:hypothetical protein
MLFGSAYHPPRRSGDILVGISAESPQAKKKLTRVIFVSSSIYGPKSMVLSGLSWQYTVLPKR